MAKVTAKITDKQSGKTETHNRELPEQQSSNILKTTPVPKPSQVKSKYALLDQDGKVVATLIDKSLAEKWLSEQIEGATRLTEVV